MSAATLNIKIPNEKLHLIISYYVVYCERHIRGLKCLPNQTSQVDTLKVLLPLAAAVTRKGMRSDWSQDEVAERTHPNLTSP